MAKRVGATMSGGFCRREFLESSGAGFGGLALAYLLRQEGQAAEPGGARPGPETTWARPGRPHLPPRARSVIFLFMDGGPSHLDLFDPKPKLQELAGEPVPASFGPVETAMGEARAPILGSRRKWKRWGRNGIPISDWLPCLGEHADRLCVIRSCFGDARHHGPAMCQMNTGAMLHGRPSLGAWVAYGLGEERANLPAFVALTDGALPTGGQPNWSAGFLPPQFQGTHFRGGRTPLPNLHPPPSVTPQRQRGTIKLLRDLNERHQASRPGESELEARIAGFELAFRMQAEATEAFDLSRESAETKRLYGLGSPRTAVIGRNCLLARRLVERGVRFVQVYCGSGCKWDAHEDIEGNHRDRCLEMDRPAAGLLADLARTGLLQETLVVWGGEFGRSPMSEKKTGRDHNPHGFTMVLAGGGVGGGQIIGATDELGLRTVEDPVHVHDLHATILHAMGLDHRQLTFRHDGRDERPTVNGGKVVSGVFA